jgi:hypothetical protein
VCVTGLLVKNGVYQLLRVDWRGRTSNLEWGELVLFVNIWPGSLAGDSSVARFQFTQDCAERKAYTWHMSNIYRLNPLKPSGNCMYHQV